jgi:hypothetical protein
VELLTILETWQMSVCMTARAGRFHTAPVGLFGDITDEDYWLA